MCLRWVSQDAATPWRGADAQSAAEVGPHRVPGLRAAQREVRLQAVRQHLHISGGHGVELETKVYPKVLVGAFTVIVKSSRTFFSSSNLYPVSYDV